MIEKLPRWIFTPTSRYDTESVTEIEAIGKLQGKMNELVDEYNKFVDQANEKIESFVATSKEEQRVFEMAMRQEFQDFIDTIEVKVLELEGLMNDKILSAESVLSEGLKAFEREMFTMLSEMEKVGNIAQTTGDSPTKVMSQKAISEIFFSAFGKIITLSFDGVEKGTLYNLNALTTPLSNSNYDTYFKSVSEGETYLVSSKVVQTTSSYVAMFYNVAGAYVSGVGLFGTDAGADVEDYPVTVPEGATLMRVSTLAGAIPSLKMNAVYPINFHETVTPLLEKNCSVSFDEIEKGICYGKNAPEGWTTSAYDTFNKTVQSGEKFWISSKLVPSSYYSVATFWDENGNFVAEFGTYSDVGTSVRDYPVEVPLNAVLMRVSTLAGVIPDLYTSEIVQANIHNVETSSKKYFVKFNGEECFIKTRYSNEEDLVIKLHTPTDHGNGLPDFERVYTVARTEPMDESLIELQTILYNTSDMFMPHKVGASANGDGDYPTKYYFTGGNHRSDNTGTGGTPTARCSSWKVFADGKELSNDSVYCNKLYMTWTNYIQGCNTTKTDGTGREILREDIRLTFDGSKINVETIHTALEKVFRTIYYGIGTVRGNFASLFFAGSKVNRTSSSITSTSTLNSGDQNCRDMILSTATAHSLCVHLDNVDLGDFAFGSTAHSAFNSNGKCYFSVIDSTFNQNVGEKTIIRGYFDFYKQ